MTKSAAAVNNAASRDFELHERETAGTYTPPYVQVLAALGLDQLDLVSEKVTIPRSRLTLLLAECLRQITVDETWYFEQYPDVHAAVLSGDTASAEMHFRTAGYGEGRLPHALPFDATYYFEQYKDLSRSFERSDVEGLRTHFMTKGYFEGRAGVPEHFEDAERWRTGL